MSHELTRIHLRYVTEVKCLYFAFVRWYFEVECAPNRREKLRGNVGGEVGTDVGQWCEVVK